MGIQVSPHILKGYITISSFLIIIQGLISLVLGMNHMIVFNGDSSWVYDFFDIMKLKINLTVYGSLLIIAGTSGMIGVFKKKNKMVFFFNVSAIVMLIYSLALLIPMVTDEKKGLPDCSNQRFQKYEDVSKQMQTFGLCTSKCPCNMQGNMQKLYSEDDKNKLSFNPDGKNSTIYCVSPEEQQQQIKNSADYNGMVKLENFYNCQGMCTLYNLPVYQFTNINRGPPFSSTCYSQLKNELEYFYTKTIASLSTQILQLLIQLILTLLQYKTHKRVHSKKNMSFYRKLSQF